MQHDFSPDINSKLPYYVNREYLEARGDFPMAQCFDSAREFLQDHQKEDNWLLHLECFDPHEPFFAPERFLRDHPEALGGKIFDWPSYGRTNVDADLLQSEINLLRACRRLWKVEPRSHTNKVDR